MIRKSAHKDTVNPPGQTVNPVPSGNDTLARNIEEWKKYEHSRNNGNQHCIEDGCVCYCTNYCAESGKRLTPIIDPLFPAAHYQDGRDLK